MIFAQPERSTHASLSSTCYDVPHSKSANRTNPTPAKCNADIYLGDAWIGETEGCWFTKSFQIYMEGIEVARVLRTQEHAAEGGFSIEMTEGVDASLILMILLALGEIYRWADNYAGGVASSVLSCGASRSMSLRPRVWRGILG